MKKDSLQIFGVKHVKHLSVKLIAMISIGKNYLYLSNIMNRNNEK